MLWCADMKRSNERIPERPRAAARVVKRQRHILGRPGVIVEHDGPLARIVDDVPHHYDRVAHAGLRLLNVVNVGLLERRVYGLEGVETV